MIGDCSSLISSTGGLSAGLFMAGLVGGFTHCAGMCGPFVISQVGELNKVSSFSIFPYHFGRITTYTALAFLTNSVLDLAFAASNLKAFIAAPMLMMAGIIFLVTAFPSLSKIFPWASRVGIQLPINWFASLGKKLSANPGVLKKYFLGVLLGFMPCGLVLSALLAASTASGPLQAGGVMALFGLGTVPALMLTAFGGSYIKTRFPTSSALAFRGVMALNGVGLLIMAAFLFK